MPSSASSSSWSSASLGRAFAAFSVRHRRLLVPFFIIGCLLVGYGASWLRFAGDYRVFFGAENPDFIANESAQTTFGRPDNVAFVLIPRDGGVYTAETLAAVHRLTAEAWSLPYVSRVDSLTNFQHTTGVGDELIVEDLVVDPGALTADRIADIARIAESEPLLNGFVVSGDGAATVVNAVVQLPAGVPQIAMRVAAEARELRERLQADYPLLDVYLTGVASLSAAFEEAGTRDGSTLIPLVYVFILVVMFATLRSLAGVLGALVVILLSTFVGMGVGGFTGVELTPISLAAPTIILTVAVADSIHILAAIRARLAAGLARHEAIIDAVALNFGAIWLTSLTTVVGFLTLNFSDSPPFHHLGNMSAAGIAAAWLLSVSLLPALLACLPLKFAGRAAAGAASSSRAERLADWVIARPRRVLFGTLGLCIGAAAFIPTLEVNDQWSKYFGERLEFRQAIDAANPHFGSDAVEFVLDPGAAGAVTDPRFLRTVDAFASWLREQKGQVAHVYAVSDIMKRVNKNLNGDDPAFFRIPDDRTVASQYLLVYELSLPYGLALNDRVDIDRRTTRVTASMRDISTGETKAFLAAARAWFDEHGGGYRMDVTGSKVLFSFVAQRNIEAVFHGAIYLVIAIFLILTIAFRSVKVGLLSLVPNVLPLLAAFGLWAVLVGVVGFSIAAVGAVAIGLIVDFSVHFLSKYLHARHEDGADVPGAIRHAYATAGAAILLTTVILAAGFAVLFTSSFKLNADMGLLTAIAVVLAMLVNLLLLPALLVLAADRAKKPAATPAPATA